MAGVRLDHRVGELVYGRVTKLVPFGSFVQVGDGIEGLVHISEMSAHHVDLPEQVVTPGEELWVKIIDLDLQRRRISLSIKQAAEGGVVAAEYQEHFGEHAYDAEGNYIGPTESSEAQEAWAEALGRAPEAHGAGDAGAESRAAGALPKLRLLRRSCAGRRRRRARSRPRAGRRGRSRGRPPARLPPSGTARPHGEKSLSDS